jgi:hypothetical protein
MYFVCDSDATWAVVSCVFDRNVECIVTLGTDYIIWKGAMVLNGKLNKFRKAALLAYIQIPAQNFYAITVENHQRDTQAILPKVRKWS